MKAENLTLALGVVGVVAAWYWSQRTNAQLNQLLGGQGQPPVLPSTPIGSGYLGPVGQPSRTFPGWLASTPIGRGYLEPIPLPAVSMAPVTVDSETGDVTASLGTDLLLPGVDPRDPGLVDFSGLPDVHPQVDFSEFH